MKHKKPQYYDWNERISCPAKKYGRFAGVINVTNPQIAQNAFAEYVDSAEYPLELKRLINLALFSLFRELSRQRQPM